MRFSDFRASMMVALAQVGAALSKARAGTSQFARLEGERKATLVKLGQDPDVSRHRHKGPSGRKHKVNRLKLSRMRKK